MARMTLTEFLLARIAEDMDTLELVMNHLEQVEHRPGSISFEGRPIYDARRALAECEAKRRIVALTARVSDLHDFWDGEQGQPDTELDPGDQILEALALPYADHPDYREEWRP